MIYRVRHTTTYSYADPVALCHNIAHLTPRAGPRQTCLQSELLIAPFPEVTLPRTDYFGNHATFFTIQQPHRMLIVTGSNETEVQPYSPPKPEETPSWEEVRDSLPIGRDAETLDAFQFTFDSPYSAASADLTEYASPSFPPNRPLAAAVLDLTRRIYSDIKYDRRATTVATPLSEVLALRRGVCQDMAHLEIGCLRSLGLAARYVSGYLRTTPPPGKERLVGGDASHAWLSVWCPGFGWIDLDPTNNQVPSDQHITLAWGRDYGDVTPIKGVILGGRHHSISVSVDVVRSEAAHEASPAKRGSD
jgi:transglutaminase-like putative cysteine protease